MRRSGKYLDHSPNFPREEACGPCGPLIGLSNPCLSSESDRCSLARTLWRARLRHGLTGLLFLLCLLHTLHTPGAPAHTTPAYETASTHDRKLFGEQLGSTTVRRRPGGDVEGEKGRGRGRNRSGSLLQLDVAASDAKGRRERRLGGFGALHLAAARARDTRESLSTEARLILDHGTELATHSHPP